MDKEIAMRIYRSLPPGSLDKLKKMSGIPDSRVSQYLNGGTPYIDPVKVEALHAALRGLAAQTIENLAIANK